MVRGLDSVEGGGIEGQGDGIEEKCDGIEGDCGGIKGVCDGIEGVCDVIEGDCDGIKSECDVIEGDCDGVGGECGGIEGDCDVIEEMGVGIKGECVGIVECVAFDRGKKTIVEIGSVGDRKDSRAEVEIYSKEERLKENLDLGGNQICAERFDCGELELNGEHAIVEAGNSYNILAELEVENSVHVDFNVKGIDSNKREVDFNEGITEGKENGYHSLKVDDKDRLLEYSEMNRLDNLDLTIKQIKNLQTVQINVVSEVSSSRKGMSVKSDNVIYKYSLDDSKGRNKNLGKHERAVKNAKFDSAFENNDRSVNNKSKINLNSGTDDNSNEVSAKNNMNNQTIDQSTVSNIQDNKTENITMNIDTNGQTNATADDKSLPEKKANKNIHCSLNEETEYLKYLYFQEAEEFWNPTSYKNERKNSYIDSLRINTNEGSTDTESRTINDLVNNLKDCNIHNDELKDTKKITQPNAGNLKPDVYENIKDSNINNDNPQETKTYPNVDNLKSQSFDTLNINNTDETKCLAVNDLVNNLEDFNIKNDRKTKNFYTNPKASNSNLNVSINTKEYSVSAKTLLNRRGINAQFDLEKVSNNKYKKVDNIESSNISTERYKKHTSSDINESNTASTSYTHPKNQNDREKIYDTKDSKTDSTFTRYYTNQTDIRKSDSKDSNVPTYRYPTNHYTLKSNARAYETSNFSRNFDSKRYTTANRSINDKRITDSIDTETPNSGRSFDVKDISDSKRSTISLNKHSTSQKGKENVTTNVEKDKSDFKVIRIDDGVCIRSAVLLRKLEIYKKT